MAPKFWIWNLDLRDERGSFGEYELVCAMFFRERLPLSPHRQQHDNWTTSTVLFPTMHDIMQAARTYGSFVDIYTKNSPDVWSSLQTKSYVWTVFHTLIKDITKSKSVLLHPNYEDVERHAEDLWYYYARRMMNHVRTCGLVLITPQL